MKRHILFGVALSLALLTSASAYATNNQNPGGNNGFVKINNEIAPDSIPQNHPHVKCSFSVEFYNYDMNNNYAKVSFDMQAPTNKADNKVTVKSGNLNPFIGEDGKGGGNDLDARENYTLAFTGPAPEKQGYHVKLTVEAPGSKGSDKKHKVFWVQPCATLASTVKTPTETTSTSVIEMPSELPETGANWMLPVLLGGFVGALAYVVPTRRNQ